jgi:hypothetical protein
MKRPEGGPNNIILALRPHTSLLLTQFDDLISRANEDLSHCKREQFTLG